MAATRRWQKDTGKDGPRTTDLRYGMVYTRAKGSYLLTQDGELFHRELRPMIFRRHCEVTEREGHSQSVCIVYCGTRFVAKAGRPARMEIRADPFSHTHTTLTALRRDW